MITTIIQFKDFTLFVIVVQFYLSIINICYLVSERPYPEPNQNRIEYLNEFVVYFSIMMCLMYDIFIPNKPYSAQNICGYIHIGFSSVNIAISILTMLYDLPKQGYVAY